MTKIKLTASQIRQLDEWHRDDTAADASLEIAINFHSNKRAEMDKEKLEWWGDIAKTHGLDLGKTIYKAEKVDGEMCVVEDVK